MEGKYIAEGFAIDLDDLLNDFRAKNSFEWSAFAEVWREHKFSHIFLGRDSKNEVYEFTQEIFFVTASFILSPSLSNEVGAIFSLYSFYRTQLLDPPATIRLLQHQTKRIIDIRALPTTTKTLHYVINYLLKNCCDFVAHPTLMGPLFGAMNNYSEEEKIRACERIGTDARSILEKFVLSDDLKKMGKLMSDYNDAKNKLNMTNSSIALEELLKNMDSLLPNQPAVDVSETLHPEENDDPSKKESHLRKLKTLAFGESVQGPRHLLSVAVSDKSECDIEEPLKPSLPRRRTRRKRTPKHERRVGRKKKVVENCVEVVLKAEVPEIKKKPRPKLPVIRNYCEQNSSVDAEISRFEALFNDRVKESASNEAFEVELFSSCDSEGSESNLADNCSKEQ